MFQKGPFSNYQTDVKIDSGYKYQINVQDLYGLMLEIDALEEEKLGELKMYINHNINSVVEAVRQPLYEHVPDQVYPYTALAFFKHYQITDLNEQQDFRQQMDKFAGTLSSLDKNTRTYLYHATQCLRPKSTNYYTRLIVSEPSLRKRLRLNPEQVQTEIEVLECANLLNRNSIDDNQAFEIYYYDEHRNEMINELIQFCEKNDRSLEKLIVDLHISELD
ncbi:hypothetical protein [Paenibacillus amylolyticus]|uniref:hypothetical protein n=1 Tax=Paenibacillus amylolyticus TaxID=1451 RepID=UPI0033960618